MDFRKVSDFVVTLEADLGVPRSFLVKLPLDDEWSFVIKVAALVEAAVSELLLSAIPDERIHPQFAKMKLRGPDGKIAFLTALGLLSREQRRFIDELYSLRNAIVHDIRRASFTFDEHFSNLSPEQVKNFWTAMVPDRDVDFLVRGPRKSRRIIWLALLNFLADTILEKAKQRGERTLREDEHSLHKSAYDLLKIGDEVEDLERDFDTAG